MFRIHNILRSRIYSNIDIVIHTIKLVTSKNNIGAHTIVPQRPVNQWAGLTPDCTPEKP